MQSDRDAITNLVYRYAELIDAGDLDGVDVPPDGIRRDGAVTSP